MAKRSKRRSRPEVPTVDYTDDEGNMLTLRQALSAKTMAKISAVSAGDGVSLEDAWQRRSELLFERLVVSWEIAGLPLTEQQLLLGRYRLADPQTKSWVRDTLSTHVERYLPELSGP